MSTTTPLPSSVKGFFLQHYLCITVAFLRVIHFFPGPERKTQTKGCRCAQKQF